MNEIRLAPHADPRARTQEGNGLQGGFQPARREAVLLGMDATRPPPAAPPHGSMYYDRIGENVHGVEDTRRRRLANPRKCGAAQT